MILMPKSAIVPCASFAAMLLSAAAASHAQTTTQETTRGSGTVTTSQLTGEVVEVQGNDLAVKLSSGEVRVFHVPATRRFLVDGKELSVGELQPRTTLTATVRTTTTPVTVRTKSMIEGRVWFVSPPSVILTLSSGENKAYVVRDGDKVAFTINGRPATIFDLRKGMNVSAQRIVEEPDNEIVTDTTVVGHLPAAVPPTESAAVEAPPSPSPEPEAAKPAPEPPPSEPAAEESPATTSSEPAAPQAQSMRPLLWVGLLALLIVVVLIVLRMIRGNRRAG